LESRGLVEVTPDPKDRRSRLMTLTPAGKAVLAEAVPIWKRTHEAIEGLLAGGASERLRADLRTLS
jgi:DNA-binding MarR family transcriptional regulator